jgi:2'-5' RNA ligase
MSYAVVLYLDPASEEAVQAVWQGLANAGVDRSMHDAGIRPHITLADSDHVDQAALEAATEHFAASLLPFRLTLSSIGLFATAEGVLFYGVTMSRGLLEAHAEYSRIFAYHARQPNAYYRLGAWVPHCTLAIGLEPERVGEAIDIAARAPLPIHGSVHEMALIRTGEGRPPQTLASFRLG